MRRQPLIQNPWGRGRPPKIEFSKFWGSRDNTNAPKLCMCKLSFGHSTGSTKLKTLVERQSLLVLAFVRGLFLLTCLPSSESLSRENPHLKKPTKRLRFQALPYDWSRGSKKGDFVKRWSWRMCSRSGFEAQEYQKSWLSSARVALQGKTLGGISVQGNIRQNHAFGNHPILVRQNPLPSPRRPNDPAKAMVDMIFLCFCRIWYLP